MREQPTQKRGVSREVAKTQSPPAQAAINALLKGLKKAVELTLSQFPNVRRVVVSLNGDRQFEQ